MEQREKMRKHFSYKSFLEQEKRQEMIKFSLLTFLFTRK